VSRGANEVIYSFDPTRIQRLGNALDISSEALSAGAFQVRRWIKMTFPQRVDGAKEFGT